jgi:N-acyl-D-aspartate/D-glutamate deacylase
MAGASGDVLFSGGPGNGRNDTVDNFGEFLDETNANHGRITLATQTRPSGTLCGLAQVAPVKGKRWKALMSLPALADRVAALKDSTVRAALIEEGTSKGMWYDPNHIYPLGNGPSPDYNEAGGVSIAQHATRLGVHPVEFVIDRLIESEGLELFNTWFFSRNVEGIAQLLTFDNVYPGLADTGAHAGQICDADMCTHYLSYWHRTRAVVTLPRAVNRLTAMPAAVLGLVDRGRLDVGCFADINVFDIDTLGSNQPRFVNDFPNGAGRLIVGSRGYSTTIVNGSIISERGINTGDRPGRVVREFRRS